MTATPSEPYTPSAPRAQSVRRQLHRYRDVLTSSPSRSSPPSCCPRPSPVAAPGAGSAGAPRVQRAEAQAAKDAAAAAFYELDTAQRDLRISIETIIAVDDSRGPPRRLRLRGAGPAHRRGQWTVHRGRRRPRPRPGRAGGVRSPPAPAPNSPPPRTSWGGSAGPGPVHPGTRAAARQGRDAARPARARRRARPSGPPRRLNALDSIRRRGLRADDLAGRLAALEPS